MLVDKAFLLSDFIFYLKNLTFLINILLDNDYSLTFIFDIVNQRIKNLIKIDTRYIKIWLTMSVRKNQLFGLRFHSFLFIQKSLSDLIETTSGFLSIVLIKWVNISKYKRILVPKHLRGM